MTGYQKKEQPSKKSHEKAKRPTVYLTYKNSIAVRLDLSTKITHHYH